MAETTRRKAIQRIGLTCATMAFSIPEFAIEPESSGEPVKLGVISDLHGGLAEDAESRLDAFLNSMKDANCDALVQLGDFAYPNKEHQRFVDKFNAAHETCIHVIGNHDLDHGVSKQECQTAWGIDSSYYQTDIGGLRIIALDGNDHGSPTYKGGYHSFIGQDQKGWLREQLTAADRPVVVLSHQPLAGRSSIDNAADIQKLLAAYAEKIVVCLNGHSHVDSLIEIGGVKYLHVNSASYYWVGGTTKMAYYMDPLYSRIIVDLDKSVVTVEGNSSQWKGRSPKNMGYFNHADSPPEEIVTPQIRRRRIEGIPSGVD